MKTEERPNQETRQTTQKQQKHQENRIRPHTVFHSSLPLPSVWFLIFSGSFTENCSSHILFPAVFCPIYLLFVIYFLLLKTNESKISSLGN